MVTDNEDRSSSVPAVPPASTITNDDRNRYGLLLDRAAQRGLIGPDDYRVRLGDLAEASTIEQMNRIVTELPAFVTPPAVRSRPRAAGVRVPRARASMEAPRRSSPWLLLVIVVAVVAVSLVVLTVYAEHSVRSRNSGLASLGHPAQTLSDLRP